MIEEVMRTVNNWFIANVSDSQTWVVDGGQIDIPFLTEGQYYRIDGSAFNDGLHIYGEPLEMDETFTGIIYALKPPRAFLQLCAEIQTWQTTYGEKAAGPYQSESFGGYTYTRATGSSAGDYSWKDAFKGRLRMWRKI